MNLKENSYLQPVCIYNDNVSGNFVIKESMILLTLMSSITNIISGGIIKLLEKIKIGDILEFDNQLGTVTSVSLYNTTIKTSRDRRIDIPNARIGESRIVRYGDKGNHNSDLSFTLKYFYVIINKARDIVVGIMKSSETLQNRKDLTNTVYVTNDKADNIVLTAFCYSENNDTWTSLWSLKNEMTMALEEASCLK